MYNYNRARLSAPTSLGLDERLERVLCYVFGWVSGLFFLLFERRNENVRRHAMQSVVVFGGLSLVLLALGIFGGLFGHILIIGWIFSGGAALLGWLVKFAMVCLWILFMVLAWMSPEVFVGGGRGRRSL
ncbi:MAG: hypothetical protein OJF49_004294 [Ktedonobacterales bacterium]|jgi:uncharacterized membrane protein|nr:MAG: hypothetical protein OJF49_004294 [Ktedonobacterales bacterium]